MDSLDHCDKCSILVNLQNGIIVGSGLYSGNIKDHNICPNSVTGEHHFLKMFKRIDESPKEVQGSRSLHFWILLVIMYCLIDTIMAISSLPADTIWLFKIGCVVQHILKTVSYP
eukprot:234936_1